jgi:hypothetical protein
MWRARNLTADARKLILGRRYNRQKKAVGKPEGAKLGQSEPISTAEKLAKENHVSPATVKRSGKFAEEAGEAVGFLCLEVPGASGHHPDRDGDEMAKLDCGFYVGDTAVQTD